MYTYIHIYIYTPTVVCVRLQESHETRRDGASQWPLGKREGNIMLTSSYKSYLIPMYSY